MKVLIVGSGLSGRSAFEFLSAKGIETEFASESLISRKNDLSKEEKDRLFNNLSFIVTSPGVSPEIPLLKAAKEYGKIITNEFELGSSALASDIIAVTGTNGKTTTVSLIYYLLKDTNQVVYLGGNIGTPVTSFADSAGSGSLAVLECSSYQLEDIKYFKPKIAAILNLTVDHMARHKTMDAYAAAKYNITKNQDESDYLLLNADSEYLNENPPKTNATVYYFSTKHKVKGCYIKNGCIYFNDNLKETKLVSIKNIKLVGEHNLSNVLCSVLAVWLITKNKSLLCGISKFEAVPHRIQYIRSINGVEYYNDSKATNIDSTLVATASFKQNIFLILGGSDKGYEFDELFKKLPKNVKFVAVCGETKNKIMLAAKRQNYQNITATESLKSATYLCYQNAKKGDVVLLSPACASFDCFKNFEERGAFFKKIVEEMSLNENARSKARKTTQI